MRNILCRGNEACKGTSIRFIENVLHRVADNTQEEEAEVRKRIREREGALGSEECLKIQRDSVQSKQRQKLELGERL